VDKKELARQIKKASFLTGQFKLRSGKISSFYWDKYRFESNPKLLTEIIEHMTKILPQSFDKLAGMELGGIPLAIALSLKTDKPCLFVRKVAKDYGTCNLVEGGFMVGETVLVIEDVITTAGQVVTSIDQMRKLGLIVNDVLCVIDREQGGREKLTEIKCSLSSLFTMTELERYNA
jgi:orotate phosphoribosyltransferase